jgi:hypothetical protein
VQTTSTWTADQPAPEHDLARSGEVSKREDSVLPGFPVGFLLSWWESRSLGSSIHPNGFELNTLGSRMPCHASGVGPTCPRPPEPLFLEFWFQGLAEAGPLTTAPARPLPVGARAKVVGDPVEGQRGQNSSTT